MIKESNNLYVKVILPLKLSGEITYSVPEAIRDKVVRGSKVVVTLINRKYIAVVDSISESTDYDPKKIRSILYLIDESPVDQTLITFWKRMAEYYMCSVGEVFRAAYSSVSYHKFPKRDEINSKEDSDDIGNNESKEGRKSKRNNNSKVNKLSADSKSQVADLSLNIFNKNLPELSEPQFDVLNRIKVEHGKDKVVLLNGVTGSGKSEIYFHLIADCLDKGKDVLYMLPEIAVSRDIGRRLSKVFGDRVFIYHSGRTTVQKREIVELLNQPPGKREPMVILGLRSSVFLPLENAGLIIVDEEHDSSYKQSDPAPRYNGRDATVLLSSLIGANVLLGSATPSFESLYNVKYGKYTEILLTEKYHNAPDSEIKVVDMGKERKKRAVKGSFSLTLINAVQERLDKGEQTLIFRSRRAYSPVVQCTSCGHIPKCPNCNIHLTYHKFNNTLSCHYCGYRVRMNPICPECGESIAPMGAGTERIEEELRELFPQAKIARFDADTAKENKEQEKILKEFASGKTDILVGTQMITKGFDFKKLTLVAVIKGESISSSNDFRSDEKALQLIIQLMGRAGRRMKQGEIIIQTSQPEHLLMYHLDPAKLQEITENVIRIEKAPPPIQKSNLQESDKGAIQVIADKLLIERENFSYPPYVRMIKITVKDKSRERASGTASSIDKILGSLNVEHSGAIPPPLERVNNEYLLQLWIKLPRTKQSERIKQLIYKEIEHLQKSTFASTSIIIDVDPLA